MYESAALATYGAVANSNMIKVSVDLEFHSSTMARALIRLFHIADPFSEIGGPSLQRAIIIMRQRAMKAIDASLTPNVQIVATRFSAVASDAELGGTGSTRLRCEVLVPFGPIGNL